MDTLEFQTALAGEFEIVFASPGSELEARSQDRGYVCLNAIEDLGQPSRIHDVVSEMTVYYNQLKPSNDKEAETRAQWLGYLANDVTLSDIVNFRIYEQHSIPGLTYATYPLGMTYSDITDHAGSLEFRGPGKLQDGWYDNDDVSELRIAPGPAERFGIFRQSLLKKAASTASREGQLAFLASMHINGSDYLGEMPLLGEMTNLSPYRAAVAGLRRVFIEGGLLNPNRYPRSHQTLRFGSQRDDNVRVMPGRIEYRGMNHYDAPDYDNGRRFLNAGMHYGFQYSTLEEQDSVLTARMLQATPLDGYIKGSDLYIKRSIEACAITTNAFDTEQNYQIEYDHDNHDIVLSALTERLIKGGDCYSMCNLLFSHGLKLGSDGFLQTNHDLLAVVFKSYRGQRYISFDDIPAINANLRKFSVAPVEQIYHHVVGLSNEYALRGLRSAKAMPSVAPEEHAKLLVALQGN